MFQTKVVEKIKTHILCSVTPPHPQNRAVYEIMWKIIVHTYRPQMTIWRRKNVICVPDNLRLECRNSLMIFVTCCFVIDSG